MAIITVTTLDDTIVAPDGEVSLREALLAANTDASVDGSDAGSGADIIVFDSSLFGTISLAQGQLVIASNVIIDGDSDGDGISDITIDAAGASRVLLVLSNTSTLDALVLTGGNDATVGGGGVLVAAGDLTIVNSTIAGNHGMDGGGIHNSGTLTLTNSSIEGNDAYDDGGGLRNSGAGVATLTNVTLSGNHAITGDGGGISNSNGLTLVNVTLSGNFGDRGGGLFNGASGSAAASVLNSTVSGNAAGTGGGIYNEASNDLTLTNSIVLGNEVTGADPDLRGIATYAGVNIVGLGGDNDPDGNVMNAAALTDVFDAVAINGIGVTAGVLADNGGAVETIAIKIGGTAHDAGDVAALPVDTQDLDGDGVSGLEDLPVDARGAARVFGVDLDIGAFEAGQFIVTTLDDEDYDLGSLTDETLDGDGLSLREALALANADVDANTIVFSTAPGMLTLTNGELAVTTNVTIDGDTNGDGTADITVSGNDASRVFNVDSGAATAITASLNGLVIRDGASGYDGGAIRVADDALIVTNSTITDNVSQRQGGAIINFGSITLTNTILSGNQSTQAGGAIMNLGTAHITNATLSGNHAGFSGGAIANYGSSAVLELTNATVSGNDATSGGGIDNTHGSTALINTTVAGNTADVGGGILNFANTYTSTLTLTNSTVSGNLAVFGGGGIANGSVNAATTLTNSIVAGNDAALSAEDDVQGDGTLTLHGGNIVGGTFTIDGTPQGGITALTEIFAEIDPVTGGGLLQDNGGPVETIALAAAVTNPAIDAGDDTLAGVPATDARGVGFDRVDVPGAAHNFTNISDLGAFELQGPFEAASLIVTTADDVVDPFDNLTSLREALAYAASNPGADIITFDGSFDTATVDGSALVIDSDVTIDGDTDGDGEADITIDAFDPFGIWRVFDVTTGTTSTLQHLDVTGGYAAGEDGGGIRILDGATLTLADVAVFDNYADFDGGGIWNDGTLTLSNSVVVGNEAGDDGGGIWNDGSLFLNESAVALNLAGDGGGIFNSHTALLTNTVLSGNTAAAGIGGGILATGSTLTLINSTLSGNSAGAGGGIANIASNVALVNSTVTGNAADIAGGIGNDGFTDHLSLTNSIVAGNEAIDGNDVQVGADGHTPTYIGGNIVGDTLSQDGTAQPGSLALTDIFAQVGINFYTGALSGVLADNSGPLPTVGIKLGGAAQDTGNDAVLPVDTQDVDHNGNSLEVLQVDARGFDRVSGSHVDLGAMELQPGQSFVVTTLDDELDATDTDPATFDPGDLSLREALVLAQQDKASYDTITFAEALDGGTLFLTQGEELVVEGNVKIDGNSDNDAFAITIDGDADGDGDGDSAVLHVYSGVVALNGLAINNGFALYGAGLTVGYFDGRGYADVTVTNSTIANNAAGYGAGIYVDAGSSLRLINSTVSGNQADVGGGILVYSGAALTVISSTITNNHADGFYGYGGGIAVYGGASATLINSTISDNSGVDGGGIYNAGSLTLINTTLANNIADYGGGLFMNDCGCGEANVISSTITGNYAGIGGGIYHAAGTLNLANSIVAGNGAGYADPDISIVAGDLYFVGNNILSQTLPGTPGGYTHEPNLANIFATVTTIDLSPVDGDEFDAGLLANNGGPVKTVAIKLGGVAHNAGDNDELPPDTQDLDGDGNTTEDLPLDARGPGFKRLVDGTVDIGAYEIQNTPPFVHHNTGLTLDEGASTTITTGALDFDDAEQGDAAIVYTVTTAPTVGTLRLNTTALGVGGTFTQDDINNSRVSYTHDDSETTADSFGFTVSDGDGGSVTGQSFSFAITPVDDTAPVQAANAGLSLNEGASAGITALQLDYNDAQEPPENVVYTITTAVAVGTLLLNGSTVLGLGATFTQDDIDDGRLSYAHDGSETTAASFGFSVTDGLNPVSGQSFAININAVNDTPVNSVPGAQALEANHSLALTGLAVTDPDAFGGSMSTTLSVDHGTLAAAALGGANVSGSGTDAVHITGTLAAINATLAGGNVVYTPTTDYFDNDQLTMVTNDGGNTGIGGPLTDTDTVAINLHTHLFGTPDNDSFVLDQLPAGDIRIDALGGFGDTLTLNFRLVDATVRYVGNTIIIDGPSRHLVVTGFEQYVFTDGTVDNNDGNPLVDDLFYYSRYHDVWNAHADADAHFATFGWHESRDPSAFFSTSTYLSAYPDVAATGINPLTHFHNNGWEEGRAPSIAFDTQHYLAANPDVAAAHVDPLEHYLLFGHQEGRTPFAASELIASNGFDYVWYLNHNPDVAAAHVDAFQHFMTVGWTEGRNPSLFFDVNGYLAHYPDVDAANINPLTHYDQFGRHEGRDPSVSFDTTSYLAAYPDVAAAGVNPLTHFLQFGIHEGRQSFADGVWG